MSGRLHLISVASFISSNLRVRKLVLCCTLPVAGQITGLEVTSTLNCRQKEDPSGQSSGCPTLGFTKGSIWARNSSHLSPTRTPLTAYRP